MPVLRHARKYPRISLSLPVRVEAQHVQCDAVCLELSAGGMALANVDHLPVSLPVQITLVVPPGQSITLDAVVWWKQGKRIGLRFDPGDANRLIIDEFVEQQLSGS
jgi:hypothetical protein